MNNSYSELNNYLSLKRLLLKQANYLTPPLAQQLTPAPGYGVANPTKVNPSAGYTSTPTPKPLGPEGISSTPPMPPKTLYEGYQAPKLPEWSTQIGLVNPSMPAVRMPSRPHALNPISGYYGGISNPTKAMPPTHHAQNPITGSGITNASTQGFWRR